MKRALVVAGLLLAARTSAAQREGFPHEKHQRLFPVCESCHAGIARDNAPTAFPPAASCVTCHNDVDVKRVRWDGPSRSRASGLLVFSHARHASRADTSARTCASCHATEAATQYMHVTHAEPATCFSCHAHRGPGHYEPGTSCTTCHVSAARAAGFTVERIRTLPRPTTHTAAFVQRHAPDSVSGATCATCHARESCARCHVNARSLAVIAALPADRRFRDALAGVAAQYPTPKDHQVAGFAERHGPAASAGVLQCANCHAQASCRTCHVGDGVRRLIARLPDGRSGATGVELQLAEAGRLVPGAHALRAVDAVADTSVRRVRVHRAEFTRTHMASVRSGALSCEGCHMQAFCSSCHTGEAGQQFHVPNFAYRHASDAYALETDCASCHNTEAFCRACHQSVGLGYAQARRSDYHNATPAWLLQHGRAARQNLTSCTTCHQQRDCMQCHSTLGWGVSPHGPEFNAARLGSKAAPMCLRCHVTKPTTP